MGCTPIRPDSTAREIQALIRPSFLQYTGHGTGAQGALTEENTHSVLSQFLSPLILPKPTYKFNVILMENAHRDFCGN